MKTIKIDFRKYPETPEISSNFELTEFQKSALESLPPTVDILNLEVENDGHHLVIINSTSQYYNPQKHELSKEIPMTGEEINDMLYESSISDINEFLTNRIDD
ncbi:MAG: hypothetical protein J1F35_05685 [Erysipelotrichales bacterium]|nr:hypothetical protein [Erysipelotrichales bacterium]